MKAEALLLPTLCLKQLWQHQALSQRHPGVSDLDSRSRTRGPQSLPGRLAHPPCSIPTPSFLSESQGRTELHWTQPRALVPALLSSTALGSSSDDQHNLLLHSQTLKICKTLSTNKGGFPRGRWYSIPIMHLQPNISRTGRSFTVTDCPGAGRL